MNLDIVILDIDMSTTSDLVVEKLKGYTLHQLGLKEVVTKHTTCQKHNHLSKESILKFQVFTHLNPDSDLFLALAV